MCHKMIKQSELELGTVYPRSPSRMDDQREIGKSSIHDSHARMGRWGTILELIFIFLSKIDLKSEKFRQTETFSIFDVTFCRWQIDQLNGCNHISASDLMSMRQFSLGAVRTGVGSGTGAKF